METKETINWQKRALELEDKLVKAKLLKAYAKDVVENWPQMTIRNSGAMTKRIVDLEEAIGFVE